MRTLDRSLRALLLSAGLGSSALAAENSERLSVERSSEASDCPSATELGARLSALRGRASGPVDPIYRVEFGRAGSVFTAIIRATDGSSRVIQANGESCASLAQATAVTLALLLDAQPHAAPNLLPAKAPPTRESNTSPAPGKAAREARRASDASIHLSLGAGALLGVVGPLAPVLNVEGGLQLGRFRAGLGGLWAVPQTLSLGPGSVRESLFAGSARACFALALTSSAGARLDACSGLLAGAQRAEATGYTTNERRTRNWLAVPAELAFSQEFGLVGLELAAAALFPLVRNEFAVDGQGSAYSAAPVSALLALRAFGALPW